MNKQQPSLSRLSRVAGRLRALSIAAMWIWPAITIGVWLVLEYIPLSELKHQAGGFNPGIGATLIHAPATTFNITWKVKIIGALVSIVPAALQFLFMRQWVALFSLYREGRVFEPENVRCFARMGRLLIALASWDILLSMPLNSLILTLDNPPGKHMLSIGLTSDQIPTLATGIVLTVIAWVMDEGCKLRRDAELVI